MRDRMRQPVVFMVITFGVAPLAARAQITSNEGDGVLNAPYRGTIDSLRECTMDIGYGEVKTHVEPFVGAAPLSHPNIDIWVEGEWDRSVLRLYEELDASGDEIDLTGTSSTNGVTVSAGLDGFKRFSLKAIGTKTLEPQKFIIKFYLKLFGDWITVTRTFRVAPITGSFCNLPGESEAFHFGTPILDVSVGNARLTVPVGQTAEMIGAGYSYRDIGLGPAYLIETSDVLLPGAAESTYIQNNGQFRLGGSTAGPYKTAYGTPWTGYLVGYHNPGEVYGPDGTHFDTPPSTEGLSRFNFIRPFALSESHPASQRYSYDGSNRVTQISDYPATPNFYIDLQRTAGVVTGITTSDGRGWTIGSDPVDGWITSIIPDGGKGARYFRYTSSPSDPEAAPRVDQVKDANQVLMYEFVYDFDSNGVPSELLEERQYVDGQLETVVGHEIVSDSLRRRKEYVETGEFRQVDFAYDTAGGFTHRLASITTYKDLQTGTGGSGVSYTTTYTHDVDNPHGNVVITEVDLPDGTTLDHEYDSPVGASGILFGLRTKTTHNGPSDGALTTYDMDYEFTYPFGGSSRLFYLPRIVKERDGRGLISEVTSDYEDGGDDSPFDGLNGEDSNQLRSRTGPTITQGTSGTRTPETRFEYDLTHRVLIRQDTDYASGAFRTVGFGYEDLLRLDSQIVDPVIVNPTGENLETRYLYCDMNGTQDRMTIDPDGYAVKTQYDNDGRVISVKRYLTAVAGTFTDGCAEPAGAFYETAYTYTTEGRLDQRIADNKDQDGNPLTPATITTEFSYDRLGRLTQQVLDPGGIGQETNFDYNWLGEVEREYDTSNRGVQRVYDGRGLVESETPLDTNGLPMTALTTTFQYDELGRLRFTYRPTEAVEERVYDDFGRLEQIKRLPGPDGGIVITTAFEYDLASNVTRTYVEEESVGVLSDSAAAFDEGGFNYESRQRTLANTNGAEDPVTQRKLDWAGNAIEERGLGDVTVADRVLTTHYDATGRVDQVQDSEDGVTVYTRDGRGNVTQHQVKLTATESAFTDTVYDALGRAIQITDPQDSQGQRHYRQRTYDSRGNLLRETAMAASGTPRQTTISAYDNAGRQTRRVTLADAAAITTDPASADATTDGVVDFEYDADGRVMRRSTYNNFSIYPRDTVTTYDPIGRVDRVTDAMGNYTAEDYLDNGRLEQRLVYDGVGTRTFTFSYDGHDRVTSQTAFGPPDLITSFVLDGLDRQVAVTDPRGITTRTGFDLAGRRSELTEDDGGPLERKTLFAYNRLSQLITQTATNMTSDGTQLDDQVTSYRYDTLGRHLRTVYPDSTEDPDNAACTDCVRMAYDLAGRMTQRTDQRAFVTAYAHDDRGLLLTRTTGTDVDTFDYDALGRMTLAQRGTAADPDAVAASVMDYTDLGYLDYEDQTILGGELRQVDYDYDQAGNRLGLMYPGGEAVGYLISPLNRVLWVDFPGRPYVLYEYHGGGRILADRLTRTDVYEPIYYGQQFSYDAHRRVTAMIDWLAPPDGPETIADYAFTHDANGNPLSQVVSEGMPDFVGDNRLFTVDRLNRLTDTEYATSGRTESTTFDLAGNRESHTDRAGRTTLYTLANPGNEYATIGGQVVSYDAAGNLAVDEASRHYEYDEHNRLTQVRGPGGTPVLANYVYDALGRRIVFEDPVAGVTTRYYYDGRTVIEERDGACPGPTCEERLRYHVNGAVYVDEPLATFDDATGEFTYYLPGQNFSVAMAGNADGSVIERIDYTPSGDFTGPPGGYFFDADADDDIDLTDHADFVPCLLGPDLDTGAECSVHDMFALTAPDFVSVDVRDASGFERGFGGEGQTPPISFRRSGRFAHDADGDRDVDWDDLASFSVCLGFPTDPACLAVHDFDTNGASDGVIDAADQDGFESCFSGANAAPQEFCFRPGFVGDPPASGMFALHGRPVDVLSDAHVLQDFRARTYLPTHARWLQRDPSGNIDGNNLYEAFGTNPLANTDPLGTDRIISEGGDLTYQSYPVWGIFGPEDPFVWRFAVGYGPDHVLIDHPRWPFAFVMQRSLAESEFNPGPWVSFRSVDEIMMKATSIAMERGGRFREGQLNEAPAIQVLDKSASNPQWVLALEFYNGLLGSSESAFAAQQITAQVRLWQARGLGNVVATAYTATTGLLAAPAGIGADLVGAAEAGIQAVADDASAVTAPALILAATGPFLYVRFADDALGGTTGSHRLVTGTGKAYSVAFEMKLPKGYYPGRSKAHHFREANLALLKRMNVDSDLAASMERLIPGIRQKIVGPRGGISQQAPEGWTWHHAFPEGTLQLVPTVQHTAPGAIQKHLHPGGRGGYAIWGR